MYPRFLQFGAFVISTYGVLAALAALCGIALWTSIARRTGLDAAKIQNTGLLAVVCVVVGARLAVQVIDQIEAGTAKGIKQEKSQASKAPKLVKEHGLIDWNRPARRAG